MAGIETVEVYRDARQAADPHLMGTLHCQRRGKGAYDINPSVDRKELSLSVDETGSTCDVSIALSAHRAWHIRRSSKCDSAIRGACCGKMERISHTIWHLQG
jgi:hypothetical protein